MSFFKGLWLVLNLTLILLILIRSPDEQSLQERIGSLKIFPSSGDGEKKIDQLIQVLIFCYFLLGFLFAGKSP